MASVAGVVAPTSGPLTRLTYAELLELTLAAVTNDPPPPAEIARAARLLDFGRRMVVSAAAAGQA